MAQGPAATARALSRSDTPPYALAIEEDGCGTPRVAATRGPIGLSRPTRTSFWRCAQSCGLRWRRSSAVKSWDCRTSGATSESAPVHLRQARNDQLSEICSRRAITQALSICAKSRRVTPSYSVRRTGSAAGGSFAGKLFHPCQRLLDILETHATRTGVGSLHMREFTGSQSHLLSSECPMRTAGATSVVRLRDDASGSPRCCPASSISSTGRGLPHILRLGVGPRSCIAQYWVACVVTVGALPHPGVIHVHSPRSGTEHGAR